MPSAQKTVLFLSATLATLFMSLADPVPVFSSMGELSEISGDEVQDVDVKSLLGDRQKWHLMARDLYKDVKTLRDEQFERDFREMVNMTAFEGVRISTPLLKPSDRCLSKNFSTERCLTRIYSVLTWYKDNWNYIEKENLTSVLVNDIKHSTKRLLEAINSQLQVRDGEMDQTSSTSLSFKSAWTRKTTVHSILFNFSSVMIDACRAINYMSRRKRGKDPKRTGDWGSADKN
ncbi:interleukin-6 precursor [Danio rerio]|uniref:Interleukin-6 n=1 Tax=Danio rerio TaxID=7955 RepID=H9A0J9_DANRE|nr:interleukin-6 precursor [Danio rerio]AFC76325.1 interleukin-6 [Danio rerio]|eukprot:NP_001248378.1 interleukin 6 (interferon, beta 2) precursor [Danio rerio]